MISATTSAWYRTSYAPIVKAQVKVDTKILLATYALALAALQLIVIAKKEYYKRRSYGDDTHYD